MNPLQKEKVENAHKSIGQLLEQWENINEAQAKAAIKAIVAMLNGVIED